MSIRNTIQRINKRSRFKRQSDQEGYQGWTNRETWALALWIDNDQGLYEQIAEIVGVHQRPISSKYTISNHIKEFVDEYYYEFWENPNKYGKNMWQDVGSYWRVDWVEIAEHYMEE